MWRLTWDGDRFDQLNTFKGTFYTVLAFKVVFLITLK